MNGWLARASESDAEVAGFQIKYTAARKEAAEHLALIQQLSHLNSDQSSATNTSLSATLASYEAFDTAATSVADKIGSTRVRVARTDIDQLENLERNFREAAGQTRSLLNLDTRAELQNVNDSAINGAWISGLTGFVGLLLLAAVGSAVGHNRLKQLKVAEATLAKQTFVIDQMSEAVILTDLSGVVHGCNATAAQLIGRTRDELLGSNLVGIIGDNNFHNNVRPTLRKTAIEGGNAKVEIEIVGPAGQSVLCEITSSCLRNSDGEITGFASIVRDVGEQRRQDDLLRRQAAVIEQMNEGVFITDLEGIIIYCNPAHARMTGYPRESVLGKTPNFMTAESDFEERRQAILATPRDQTIDVEVRGRHATGFDFVVSVTGRGLKDANNNYVGRVWLVRDMTEIRTKEDQLRQAQKMEAVGHLTGGIAHDFNNLLGILLLNLQIIADRDSDPTVKNLTARSLNAVRRGAALVRQMLAFSRKQSLQPVALRLHETLANMRDILRRSLPTNIEIVLDTPATLWTCVADATQLDSAILNLAINARDAMPQGGTLTIRCANQSVSSDTAARDSELIEGEFVCISVSDSGVGIAPDVLPRVIDPFFTTKEVGQGSGLGLSMVYGFVKQSNGLFLIRSTVNVGTTVSISLPRGPDLLSQDATDIARSNPAQQPARARVLLVEDNEDMRDSTAWTLTSLGYDVVTASDGETAKKMIEDRDDIMILIADVMLTGAMNGVDLADFARARRPKLKILNISGYSEKALRAGGTFRTDITVLAKPFSRADLTDALDKMKA